MNRRSALLVIVFTFTFSIIPLESDAIDWVKIIRAAIAKVLAKADLKIQKLITETQGLQTALNQIENTLKKLKLDEISEWSDKQKQLYAKYYDELWKIKTEIQNYKRYKDILLKQEKLFKEYKKAYEFLVNDDNFTEGEKGYMFKVYMGILDESIKNLDVIELVINNNSTRMHDAKRIELINKAALRIEENYNDLKSFSNSNLMLSINRTRENGDIQKVRKLYEIK